MIARVKSNANSQLEREETHAAVENAHDDRREHAVACGEGDRGTCKGGHCECNGRNRIYCCRLEDGFDNAPRDILELPV